MIKKGGLDDLVVFIDTRRFIGDIRIVLWLFQKKKFQRSREYRS